MNHDTAILAAAAASLGCLFFGRSYNLACRDKHYRRAFFLKGLAGICFVLVAVSACLVIPSGFGAAVCPGLILGLIADEILVLRRLFPKRKTVMFTLGTLVFAAGHLCYLKALYQLYPFRLLPHALVFAAMLAAGNYYGAKQGSHAGKLQGPAVFYMTLVIFMGASAVSTFLGLPGSQTGLFAIGGLLFAISDNVLFAASYGKFRTWKQSSLVHVTYYLAQLLIAWSLFF